MPFSHVSSNRFCLLPSQNPTRHVEGNGENKKRNVSKWAWHDVGGEQRNRQNTFLNIKQACLLVCGRRSTNVTINLSLTLKNELWKSICICVVLSAFYNSGSQGRESEGNYKVLSNGVVFGSNVKRKQQHPDWGSSWLCSVPPNRYWDTVPTKPQPLPQHPFGCFIR
jgi:hypothetical protein